MHMYSYLQHKLLFWMRLIANRFTALLFIMMLKWHCQMTLWQI